MEAREFTLENEYQYVRSGPVRWIISHLLRYPLYPLIMTLMAILANVLESWSRVLVGQAFDVILSPQPEVRRVLHMALSILAAQVGAGSWNCCVTFQWKCWPSGSNGIHGTNSMLAFLERVSPSMTGSALETSWPALPTMSAS